MDISHAVHQLVRHVADPCDRHWVACKRVFCYLRGTLSHALNVNTGSPSSTVTAYSDSVWVDDPDERRSSPGYICSVGGSVVSAHSNFQRTAREYVAAADSF